MSLVDEGYLSSEHQLEHQRWINLALVLGWNELAKKATVLEQKTYFRLGRDSAEDMYVELGGNRFLNHKGTVCVIECPGTSLFIRFREEDIEKMREAVRKYDEGEDV